MICLKPEEEVLYERIATTFLNKLYDFPTISLNNFNRYGYPIDFKVYSGCTRIVLVPNDESAPYILKVSKSDEKIDYNWLEEKTFKLFEENSFGDVFAETNFWRSIAGIDFYLQEFITPKNNHNDDDEDWDFSSIAGYCSEKTISTSEDICFCAPLIEDMIKEEYPLKYIEELVCFCDLNFINDLHSGNYGFNREGNVKIYDYAGIGNAAEHRF